MVNLKRELVDAKRKNKKVKLERLKNKEKKKMT